MSIFTAALQLSASISLLMLSNGGISDSLLHNTSDVRLSGKPRRLIFHIRGAVRLSGDRRQLCVSPPLIIDFGARLVGRIGFHLPHLRGRQRTGRFSTTPHLRLLSNSTAPVPMGLSVLTVASATGAVSCRIRIRHCGGSTGHTSLPRFTAVVTSSDALLSNISRLSTVPPRSRILARRQLGC